MMSMFPRTLCLTLPLLGSCALPGTGGKPTPTVVEASASRDAMPAPVVGSSSGEGGGPVAVAVDGSAGGSAPQSEPAAASPQEPGAFDAEIAAIFRSPAFRERFAESYLAETDIEPQVSDEDREVLLEVSELLATAPADNPGPVIDQAISRLQAAAGPSAGAAVDCTLGSLLFQRERGADAIPFFERAVGKFAKFRRAWNNLGFARMRLGNTKAAALAFVRVLELGGGNAATYGLLGFAHASNEDFLAAESAYRMAALLDPATIDWRIGLAHTFLKQRRFAEAAGLCGALLVANPDRADLWLRQANAYVGMNEPRRAIENLELVDRLGQATADSLAMLGDIYVNEDLADLAADAYLRSIQKGAQGKPDRALRAAKALAARSAHADSARLLEGIDAVWTGRLDDATRKDMLKLRARLAVATGGGEAEAKILEQIVALDPLDGEALILLGQYHGRNGQPDLAVLQYERAAGIPAFEADAKVRHAQLLVGQGKNAEALPLLKRAQQVKPRDHVQQFLDQVERLAQNK
jgi:tetratricopeptide (TPR) repeat protein